MVIEMSQESDVQDASLPWMTKLKNRMIFKVDQWVNDPAANRFAKQRNPSQSEPVATEPPKKSVSEKYEDTEEPEDPNEGISFSRILKKTWKYLVLIIQNAFFPILALILASYVANEMIVFPVSMRFAVFVFVLVLAIVVHPIAIGLAFYYACKKGYSYYVNDMGNGPTRRIMPHLFAILPLTTYQYEGFSSFFMYPFTYPKTEEDERELPLIMADYYKSLEASFGYLKKVANLPFFVEGIKKIKSQMEHMHDKKFPPEEQEESKEETEAPLPPVIVPVETVSTGNVTGPSPPLPGQEQKEETETASLPPIIGQTEEKKTEEETSPTISSPQEETETTPSAPPLPPVIPSQKEETEEEKKESELESKAASANETSKASSTELPVEPTKTNESATASN